MKISFEVIKNENPYITSKCIYKFRIVSSVLKKHYKALARMSILFNSRERNVGFIKKEDKQAFLALIEEIENSNDKRCATSHKKAVEKVKRSKISFDDYVEEHLDMHVALMSEKEKEEAYQSYKTL